MLVSLVAMLADQLANAGFFVKLDVHGVVHVTEQTGKGGRHCAGLFLGHWLLCGLSFTLIIVRPGFMARMYMTID